MRVNIFTLNKWTIEVEGSIVKIYCKSKFITSYYLDTLLEHNISDELRLYLDIPEWTISARDMSLIIKFLKLVKESNKRWKNGMKRKRKTVNLV